jgi:hypothetical protein
VLLFLVLLMSLWAAVHRSTASLLRVETARLKRDAIDAGMLTALGKAMKFLEAREPIARSPVTYGISLSPSESPITDYTAVFTPLPATSDGWSVEVSPGLYPDPLPDS